MSGLVDWDKLAAFEIRIIGLMDHYGLRFLRIAMGIVFIWFGALKPLGLSPAAQLVLDVTGWIPIPNFVSFLGYWEIVIGICFLFKPLLRGAILLLFLHMPGTMLPFFLVPEQCWTQFPFALSLEGQYIVKNLVLVSAALVIGGAIRHRMSGFTRFSPSELMALFKEGEWGSLEPGNVLIKQGSQPEGIFLLKTGEAQVLVDGEPFATLSSNQFVGEISFLTGQPASATVLATQTLRYIFWPGEKLEQLMEEKPGLAEAFHASLNMDLIGKLTETRSVQDLRN